MSKVILSASRNQFQRVPRTIPFCCCRLYSATPATGPASAISAAIKKDHRELEEYYNNIINAKDHDEATRWQNQFTWELARHSIAEELVVYPAFEKNLGAKGKEMADKDRDEHQIVRTLPVLFFRMLTYWVGRSRTNSMSSSPSKPVHRASFLSSRVS